MTELYRFTSGAEEQLVTDDFLEDNVRYTEGRLEEFRTEIETGTEYEVDLEKLSRVFNWVRSDKSPFDENDARIDAAVAPAVRECIDVPRRIAGDARVWHYLAVGEFPDFFFYRWPADKMSKSANRMRLTVSTEKLYRIALGRLWFMADLTNVGGNYEMTERILERQYVANRIFDRTDLRQSEVVQGFVRAIEELPDDEFIDNDARFEWTAKAVRHDLSTLSGEGLTAKDMKEIIVEKHSQSDRWID